MNIQSAFAHLEKLERNLSLLYAWFSEMFREDPDAATLFYRMSLEEKAHLALIQYQKRIVRRDPALFKEVAIDPHEIQDLSDRVAHILYKRQPPPLKRCVAVALQFEQSAAEYHYRNAFVQSRPEMAALIKNLVWGDKQHQRGLREFAQARGFTDLLARPLPRFPNL